LLAKNTEDLIGLLEELQPQKWGAVGMSKKKSKPQKFPSPDAIFDAIDLHPSHVHRLSNARWDEVFEAAQEASSLLSASRSSILA